MNPVCYEVLLQSIPGPTYFFQKLFYGRKGKKKEPLKSFSPREVALKRLSEIKFLSELGIRQLILPPYQRPDPEALRLLGFQGTEELLSGKIYKENPDLLALLTSQTPLWVSSSATVTSSIDSVTGRVQITPANLVQDVNRIFEKEKTEKILRAIFLDSLYFQHHLFFPSNELFSDFGATNSFRLCRSHSEPAVILFLFQGSFEGEISLSEKMEVPKAIVRSHQIYPDRFVLGQMSPEAFEEEVYSGDLLAIAERNFFLYHEESFLNHSVILEELESKVEHWCDTALTIHRVSKEKIPLSLALDTYFFNSLLLTLPDNSLTFVASSLCERDKRVAAYLQELVKSPENPIKEIHFFDDEGFGGGPASRALPLVLTHDELYSINPNLFFHERLYHKLVEWIEHYYRDSLSLEDFEDKDLVEESRDALHALAEILRLGSSFYG